MTIETGALEQVYVKLETAFKVSPADTLAATDGIRHLDLSINSKKNREPSPEKRGTPDESQSLPRRQTTVWDLPQIYWEPSGTLGTISNVGKLIKGLMGTQTAPNLNTTVASGSTATGATLTSGAGLAVGDCVVVTMPAGHREVTRLKTVAGAVVTWDALSVAPSVGAAVVSGVNFKLASNVSDSFAIYKYYNAGGFKQAGYGAVVDQCTLSFDGSKEVMLAFSGPGADYADSTVGTVQAKPGAHTTVGSPAAGMVGNVYVDGTAFLVIAATVKVVNQVELRNKEIGTNLATGIAGRTKHREVMATITFYLEDTNLIGKANSVTKAVLRLLIGNANGSMVGAVLPSLEFEIPDIPQGTGPMEVTVEARGYATSGNDAVFLCEA